MVTRGEGGRPRWNQAFSAFRAISLLAQVRAKATHLAQRRRIASTMTAAALTGIVTTPPPTTLSTLQIHVSHVVRTSIIQPNIVVSNRPTKRTVVSGATSGGWRPTRKSDATQPASSASDHANARRWLASICGCALISGPRGSGAGAVVARPMGVDEASALDSS